MSYSTLRIERRRISKVSRREAERRAKAVQAATSRFEPAVQSAVSRFFALLAAEVGTASFITKLAEGDVDGAYGTLGVATARQGLVDSFQEAYGAAVGSAGDVTAASMVEYNLGFDVQATATQRYIEQRTGLLVTRITDQTRESIRGTISRAIERGTNPRVAAKEIESMVGLTRPHSIAVDRFRERLERSGLKPRVVAERADRYAARLTKYRSQMIARTEMLDAANAGSYDYWRQLSNQGVINPTTVGVEWVTTDDDRTCEECAPMDGSIVGFEQKFTSENLGLPGQELRPRTSGPVLTDRPPLHPMCRCVLSLVT